MENELEVAQVEIVVREHGQDVVLIGFFPRSGGRHDVVAGYPSQEVLIGVAALLLEVGHTLMSEDWVSVSSDAIQGATGADGSVDFNQIPF